MRFEIGKAYGYEFLDTLASAKGERAFRMRNLKAQRTELLRILSEPRGGARSDEVVKASVLSDSI
jgi:hypothetical protein